MCAAKRPGLKQALGPRVVKDRAAVIGKHGLLRLTKWIWKPKKKKKKALSIND